MSMMPNVAQQTTAGVEPVEPSGPPAPPPAPRLDSVDLLRGVIMVLMVLDHTRDYFTNTGFNPTDLTRATPGLFLTRWVTHFCAPGFAFLAGAGASLAGSRGMGRGELARFLATRGLWLIFLEETVEKFGLLFKLSPTVFYAMVLWSIGGSLVLLAGLVALGVSRRAVAALGVLIIATHNLTDGLSPGTSGGLDLFLAPLLKPFAVGSPPGFFLLSGYPLIPWFGVVASGYGFGEILGWEPARRRRATLAIGLGLTAAFVTLRALNGYGDPAPWSPQASPLLTALSFINATKQPPSLMFVCMTLGPALVALSAFERGVGRVGRPFVTLGRVPLFFYLLQWYVIHGVAWLAAWAQGRPTAWVFADALPPQPPAEYAYSLPAVYVWWVVVLALMFGPCAWFAGVKRRHRDVRWLSYL
jgi:uncharacterized membrane protein